LLAALAQVRYLATATDCVETALAHAYFDAAVPLLGQLALGVSLGAYSRRSIRTETPDMTASTTTPLESKFGPIVADAAGTITVQEASDVLGCSRFRIGELLTASHGRVPVTDVLALRSPVPPGALEVAPAAKLVG
jgi:hypothetical protein